MEHKPSYSKLLSKHLEKVYFEKTIDTIYAPETNYENSKLLFICRMCRHSCRHCDICSSILLLPKRHRELTVEKKYNKHSKII